MKSAIPFCVCSVSALGASPFATGFSLGTLSRRSSHRVLKAQDNDECSVSSLSSRRSLLNSALVTTGSLMLVGATPEAATASVGTLPEFSESNAIIQGITVNVADKSQQDAMISFLVNGFEFQVLRKRIKGSVEETWLGYGPEQLSIPDSFELPVSSFAKYGGHASIHLKYDAQASTPLYRTGDDTPGNNIAFLQVGVPQYRISQMVANGGKIVDAYGLVNVVSPSGLPIRGIVGVCPDPIMFLTVNCKNVKESAAFYEQLGFVEQEYPFSRPSKGTTMFEPDKPKTALYMAPSANCMGVLLQQSISKKIAPNPAVESLNIVYNPSADASTDGEELVLQDPSGLSVRFQSVQDFTKEEKVTQ